MTVADAAALACDDFSKRGNKATQQLHVFVINVNLLVHAEQAVFLLRFLW